ncbi:hypothetical protein CASFOL_028602 [Castilleja foliolosa]|uniref:Uncharacterized protein n=1 Tax=Castilleja foliolosa TaxID=1961234 RepID=A0ABD3CCF3_9LAMI
MEYVRHRGVGDPSSTPIICVTVQTGKAFAPIRVTATTMMKEQLKAKDSVFKIRHAVRPPKDSDGAVYLSDRHKKQMSAYLAYLSSDSEEEQDVGNTLPETAAFFKEIENSEKWMEIQVVDAYLRILIFSPEFLGCHPEAKGKYTILGFYTRYLFLKYPKEIIPIGVKGKAEKLNLEDEQVKLLLDIVLGKTTVVTEKWSPLVPFTEVQKFTPYGLPVVIFILWLLIS